MKKLIASHTLLFAVVLVLGLIWAGGCVTFATTQLPSDAQPACVVTPSTFNNWFVSGSVALDGVVKPANSVTFPNIPNCSFYQWTEQMFLWLTSPTPPNYGGGGGRIFASPAFYTISPPDTNGERTLMRNTAGGRGIFSVRAAQLGKNKLPVVMEQGSRRLFEMVPPVISRSGKQLIQSEKGDSIEIERAILGEDQKPIFFDKSNRPIPGAKPILPRKLIEQQVVQKFMIGKTPIFLGKVGNVIQTEQGQADGGQVLMSTTGSLVYFVSYVNEVFAYFLTGAKNSDPLITNPNFFPTTQSELDGIINYAAAHGKTIVDPEALAIEVKTAWVEESTIPNSNKSDYITMMATIPTYNTSNPAQWVPTGQKTVKMALVGMHVVGSAAGHKEMIWGTIEHMSNTPNAAYSYINSSNANVNVPQNTNAGPWLFCFNGATDPFTIPHMNMNGSNIKAITPHNISPSNTLRTFPWGTIATDASSNTEIIALNNSVRGMLASGDVRRNYMHTGTTWTIGGAPPSTTNQVGTAALTNSTMETYQIGTNCFDCHTTNTVNVSRMYNSLKKLF